MIHSPLSWEAILGQRPLAWGRFEEFQVSECSKGFLATGQARDQASTSGAARISHLEQAYPSSCGDSVVMSGLWEKGMTPKLSKNYETKVYKKIGFNNDELIKLQKISSGGASEAQSILCTNPVK